MSLGTTTYWNGPFTGDGANATFGFTFPVSATTEVIPLLDGTPASGNYTVSLTDVNNLAGGGSVVFDDTFEPASGVEVILIRRVPYLQPTDLTTGYNADAVELAIDRVDMQVQQIESRAMMIADAEVVGGMSGAISGTPSAGSTVLVNADADGFMFGGLVDGAIAVTASWAAWLIQPLTDVISTFMQSALVATTAHLFAKAVDGSLTLATKAALSALTSPASNVTYLVKGRAAIGDGYGGVFYWNSADLSAQVTIDTTGAIYVAPDSDATGASGAFVRDWDGHTIAAQWFGVTMDGTTDDTTAWAACRAFAISRGSNGGAEIILPAGDMKITDEDIWQATDDVVTGVRLRGVGGYAGAGTTRILYTPASSKRGLCLVSAIQFSFSDIEFISANSNVSVLLDMDAQASPVFSGFDTTFEHCSFRPFSATSPTTALIQIRNCSLTLFTGCWFTGTSQKILLGGDVDGTKAGSGSCGLTEFHQCQIYVDVEAKNVANVLYHHTSFARSDSVTPVRIYPSASGFVKQNYITFQNCYQVSTTDQNSAAINFWTQGSSSYGLYAHNNRFDGYVVTFDVTGLGYAEFSANVYNPPTNPSGVIGIRLGSSALKATIGPERFTALISASQTDVQDNRSAPTETWSVTQWTRALKPATSVTYGLGDATHGYTELYLGDATGVGRVRRVQLSIADDAVGTVALTAGKGYVIFAQRLSAGKTTMFGVDLVGTFEISAVAEGSSAATMDYSTGTLTGTTGTDTHTTFSIGTSPDATLYVENREGATVTWVLWLLG